MLSSERTASCGRSSARRARRAARWRRDRRRGADRPGSAAGGARLPRPAARTLVVVHLVIRSGSGCGGCRVHQVVVRLVTNTPRPRATTAPPAAELGLDDRLAAVHRDQAPGDLELFVQRDRRRERHVERHGHSGPPGLRHRAAERFVEDRRNDTAVGAARRPDGGGAEYDGAVHVRLRGSVVVDDPERAGVQPSSARLHGVLDRTVGMPHEPNRVRLTGGPDLVGEALELPCERCPRGLVRAGRRNRVEQRACRVRQIEFGRRDRVRRRQGVAHRSGELDGREPRCRAVVCCVHSRHRLRPRASNRAGRVLAGRACRSRSAGVPPAGAAARAA